MQEHLTTTVESYPAKARRRMRKLGWGGEDRSQGIECRSGKRMGQRDSMACKSTAENAQEKPAGWDRISEVDGEVMQGQEDRI